MAMNNILTLRNAIRDAGYCITSFFFSFNDIDTIVLFEDAKVLNLGDQYTIAALTFIDRGDINHRVSVLANTAKFDMEDPHEFREFFNIHEGSVNPWEWKKLYESFNLVVPCNYHSPADNNVKNLMAQQLGTHEHDHDPNALYCYDLRRLPVDNRTNKQMERSIFIDNKTRLLYPVVYEGIHAKNDSSITFYYSPREEDGKTNEELLEIFTMRYGAL